MLKKLLFSGLFLPSLLFAQTGPLVIIDSSMATAGATKFTMTDIDRDGDNELITSLTGTKGKLACYDNLGGGSFGAMRIIDSFPFCRGVASGDFDGDGWRDLVAIGGIQNEAKIYLNDSGAYVSGITLDTQISIAVNDIVVADFDMNNGDDMAIIGQHSIDFYRNNGQGIFTKEPILTTSTSPKPLECLDLAAKDMDNDGDMDLVCGETAGLVVYINSGNAVFTPHYYSTISEIIFLIHVFDVDQDNDWDVVTRNSANEVAWFSNDGSGQLSFQSVLPDIPKLTALQSIDYNNDGLEDIYASYPFHLSIFLNGPQHFFSTEIPVHQDNNLIMGPVLTGNMDNQNGDDYAWSGGNKTIAYFPNQNSSSLSRNKMPAKNCCRIFPNPTKGTVWIETTFPESEVRAYDMTGKLLITTRNTDKIDLSAFPDGLYYFLVKGRKTGHGVSYKIRKK